jgi:hypothetical protein
MIAEYEKKSNKFAAIWLGLLVVGLGLVFSSASAHSQALAILALCVMAASLVMFYCACWLYGVAKGYSGAVGLLGLLGLIGLIVLLVLPDKTKGVAAVQSETVEAA